MFHLISVDYIIHLFWKNVKCFPYINEQCEHIFNNLQKYTPQVLHNNACYVQMKLLEIEHAVYTVRKGSQKTSDCITWLLVKINSWDLSNLKPPSIWLNLQQDDHQTIQKWASNWLFNRSYRTIWIDPKQALV